MDYKQLILATYQDRAWKIAELITPGSAASLDKDKIDPKVALFLLLEQMGFTQDVATLLVRLVEEELIATINEIESGEVLSPHIIQIVDGRFIILQSKSGLYDMATNEWIAQAGHMPVLSVGISLAGLIGTLRN